MSMFCNIHAPERCEMIFNKSYPDDDYLEAVNNDDERLDDLCQDCASALWDAIDYYHEDEIKGMP